MKLYLATYSIGKGNNISALAFLETEKRMRENGVKFLWEQCKVASFYSGSANQFHHGVSTNPSAAYAYAHPRVYQLSRILGASLITDEKVKRFCEEVAEASNGVVAFQNMLLPPLAKARKNNRIGVYVSDSIPKGISYADFVMLRSPEGRHTLYQQLPNLPENHVFYIPLIPEPIATHREEDYERRKRKGTKGTLDIVLNPSGSGIPYDGIPFMESLLPLLNEDYSLTVIGPRPPFNQRMIDHARQYCRNGDLKDPIVGTTYKKPGQRQVIFVTSDDMMALGREGIIAISNSDLVVSPPNEVPFLAEHDCCPSIIYPPDRGLHETKNREEAEGRKTAYVLRGHGKQIYLTCGAQIKELQEQELLNQLREKSHTYEGPYLGNEGIVNFVARMVQ